MISQKSISEATLMPMGKGFAVKNNLDLGNLVLQGYELHMHATSCSSHGELCSNRKDLHNAVLPALCIAAIANDTVATFASLGYEIQASQNEILALGLVVGTGVNAAVPMRLGKLHESKQAAVILHKSDEITNKTVVVNTELSIRGTAEPLQKLDIITQWDQELDKWCSAPGFQPLEYMTGGRYLGEVVRLIMYDYFVTKQHWNPEDLPKALAEQDGVSTEFLATVIASISCTALLLNELNETLPTPANSPWKWTVRGTELFREATRKVQKRAAGIIAAAIVALLACSGQLTLYGCDVAPADFPHGEARIRQDLIVAYTGSTIVKYPGYLHSVRSCVDELISLLNSDRLSQKVIFREATDGGIIGAGVLAATVWNYDSLVRRVCQPS